MLPNRRRSSRSSMSNSIREIGREIGLKDDELCPKFAPRLSNIQPGAVTSQVPLPLLQEPPHSILSTSKIPTSIPRLPIKPIGKSKIPERYQSATNLSAVTPCTNQSITPASRPRTTIKTTGKLQFNATQTNTAGPSSSRSAMQRLTQGHQPRHTVGVQWKSGGGTGVNVNVSRSVSKTAPRVRSHSASRRVDTRPSLQKSRALSSESLCFTPFATPKNSFNFTNRRTGRASFAPKSPGGKYGAESQPSQRQCKAPDSTNKKALARLAMMVNEYLQDMDYPKKMTIDDFMKMTVTEYFNICKFILGILQYPIPVSATKPDDMIQVLIDASHVYKYSLTLTRSVLKTPTSPHSWPAALSFIAWLSNRADASTVDRFSENKAKNIDALSDNNIDAHFDRQLSDTYIRLYHCYLVGACNLDEEEERFRNDLIEFCMIDTTVPIESIEALKESKLAELNAFQAEEDPTKQLQSDIEKAQAEIIAGKKYNSELIDLIHKYENLDNVESKRVLLEKKIQFERARLMETSDVVDKQPISIEKKLDMLKEIEDCSKAIQSLTHVINDMSARLDRSNQVLENVKAGFYRSCEQLKISDSYNARLDKLENLKVLNGIKRIKRNPFDAAQLDGYLTEHTELLNNTSIKLQELKHHIFTHLRESKAKSESMTVALEDLDREYKETEDKLRESEIKMREKHAQLGNHLKALEIKLKEEKKKRAEFDAQLADSKRKVGEIIQSTSEAQKKLDSLKIEKKHLDDQVLNAWLEIKDVESKKNLEIVRATIETARNYKAVYEKLIQQQKNNE